MKDILTYSPDRVLILNAEGKPVFVNDQFLEYTGYDRKDKSKLNLNHLVGPLFKKTIDAAIRNGLAFNSMAKFNFSKSVKKNAFIFFNIWNEKIVIGRVLILLDSNKMPDKLKNNLFEESILRTMNSRSDSVWFMSNIQTGKNTFTSESVKNILGWEASGFILGGWLFFFSIVHPDDIPNILERHQEWVVLKNKLGVLYDHVEFTNSFRLRNLMGEYVPIDTDSNVLERDEEGKIKMIFGSYRLVDQKTMENKIAELKAFSIKIIDGKTYVELDYLKKLREELEETSPKPAFKHLSSRELEIFELIIEELSSIEISKKLNISIHTINLHRKQIMKKLEAKNLAGLIRIYYTSK